jgi:hypothetical protein
MEVHAFLTSAKGGDKWSDSRSGSFNLAKESLVPAGSEDGLGPTEGLDAKTPKKKTRNTVQPYKISKNFLCLSAFCLRNFIKHTVCLCPQG